MLNKKIWWGIPVMALVFGMLVMGCGSDSGDSGGTTAVPVPSDGFGDPPVDPPPVTTPKTHNVTNNEATLGITGTSARSSNVKVATVAVNGGNIVITSVGKGVATITVEGPSNKSDAEIEIRVAQDGTITRGRIVKGGDDVIIISGTFGGVTINGEPRPVRLTVQFEYDGSSQIFLEPGSQSWSIKHMPLNQDTPLWFQAYIPTTGDLYYSTGTGITYQYNILQPVRNSDITGISIPAVTIPSLITISGSAGATLKGTWNRDKKYVQVTVTNNNITTSPGEEIEAGWSNAVASVVNGNWTLDIPSSSTTKDISFSVRLTSSEPSGEWNYLGYWEMGQKNNLNPTTVSTQNKSGINLGTIPFVMVSGKNPVTVNGKRPFSYWIEFGYYSDANSNGWSGSTGTLYEATGSSWSVPMPANIKLGASIYYREKSGIQVRERHNGEDVYFNTGNEPSTLNLSSISTIYK